MKRHALLALLCIAALTSGCRADDPAPTAGVPSLVWGDCPDDIEQTFLSRHECGTLTVLQDRDRPDGPTLALRVVKVWPVGVEPRPGLVTGISHEYGDPNPLNGDIATGATRKERISIGMEYRGEGPAASPSLTCPETADLGTRAAGLPDEDHGLRAEFTAAVADCAARLRDAGVEPAEFGPTQMAADLDELRAALSEDRWQVIGSYGRPSVTLLDYLTAYPDRAASVYLDSPAFPGDDAPDRQAAAFEAALDALVASCAAEPSCAADHPDLRSTWTTALATTATTPLTGSVTVDGVDVPVLVDDAKLLRFVRFALGGDGPANAAQLPRILGAAARGRLDPTLATLVAQDPVFCAGYRPFCTGQQDFALGVFLTQLCEQPAAPTATLAGVEERVFARSPYVEACAAWDVPTRPSPAAGEPIDVPALLLRGDLDSWSPARDVDGASVASVVVPGTTHNVLGFSECAINLRNAWSFDPTAPVPSACPPTPVDFD